MTMPVVVYVNRNDGKPYYHTYAPESTTNAKSKKGEIILTGLFLGLAIMLSLVSGMVSILYVFEKVYLDIPQLESNPITGNINR